MEDRTCLRPSFPIWRFRRLATLPLATYQAGERPVLSAASTTGRLLILKERRARSRS
jgi:hypothetical protein